MNLAFLALTLPGIALAATCPKPDPAAVVKTMTDMYAAATVDDDAKLAAFFPPTRWNSTAASVLPAARCGT